MDWVSAFGNLSFALSAFSFLMKDMVRLRIIAILSAIFGLIFNYFVATEPLWLVIFWLSLFLVINLYMVISVFLKNKSAKFNADEKEMFETLFSELSPFEFLQLTNAATWLDQSEKNLFIKEGEKNEKLALIWSGKATVMRNGVEITKLGRGSFIGELSYFNDSIPKANVLIEKGCKLLVWEHEKLRAWLHDYQDAAPVFNKLITSDLAAKI